MRARNEQGVALITVMLLLMLISTLLVGTAAMVVKDQRSRFQDHDRTNTFYAAHGGLEKLTNDLGRLFAGNYSPTDAQIKALTENPPKINGMRFDLPGQYGAKKGYAITRGTAENKTLSSGDYAGLKGIVTPYTVSVTAKSGVNSEVTLVRTVNSVAIPVFQFGIFSESDLSFFPGPEFNFGGRVHTNGNLWLAKGTNNRLILANKVTAYKDVIRTQLSNTKATDGNGYAGEVRLLAVDKGCDKGWVPKDPELKCKIVEMADASLDSSMNPQPTVWKAAHDKFGGYIKNGPGGKGGEANSTGAVKLTLPITAHDAQPIDLIRRPKVDEDTDNPNLYLQRYYQLASVRILLSDNAADLNNLPDSTYVAGTSEPVDLTTLTNDTFAPSVPNTIGIAKAGTGTEYLAKTDEPLVTGFLKVEMQNQAGGAWTDVTAEWLKKGYTGKSLVGTCTSTGDAAIIRIQRVKDSVSNCTAQRNIVPNVLYDTREGRDRDVSTDSNIYLGGVMHYVELDIKNLRIWLADQRANNKIMDTTGYVVYFSDRRNNHKGGEGPGTETGEYGYEDVVKRNDGTKDQGEDVNGNNKADNFVDTYGATPSFLPQAPPLPRTRGVLDTTAKPWHTISAAEARVNRAILFRRALKLVNGNRANMYYDKPANDPHGLTVVAENPVYIEGDYNADTPATEGAEPTYATQDHVACAVIADAVTLLSKNWRDDKSFTYPNTPANRKALTTTYRTAIVSGKGLSFDHFTGDADFGTDGGTHNFLRYLEGWNQPTNGKDEATLNYKGSIVSLYYNHQAVGTYKCCKAVYGPPRRQFFFDDDFLDQNKLPPRTPMFRAIDVTSFSRMNEPPPAPTTP